MGCHNASKIRERGRSCGGLLQICDHTTQQITAKRGYCPKGEGNKRAARLRHQYLPPPPPSLPPQVLSPCTLSLHHHSVALPSPQLTTPLPLPPLLPGPLALFRVATCGDESDLLATALLPPPRQVLSTLPLLTSFQAPFSLQPNTPCTSPSSTPLLLTHSLQPINPPPRVPGPLTVPPCRCWR